MTMRVVSLIAFVLFAGVTVVAQESKPATDPNLFVAGTVYDGQGNGVNRAKIIVKVKAQGGGDNAWDELDFHQEIYSDFIGRFAIHARMPSDEYAIVAQKEDYTSDDLVPFKAGAANVRVTVYAAGALGGNVLVDPSVFPSSITVEVRPDVPTNKLPTDDRDEVTIGHPGSDGKFKITPLKAGKYEVTIYVGDREVLAHAVPVSVRTGETCVDVRLKDLDLRAKLRNVRVTVTDTKGEPIKTAKCIVLPPFGTHTTSNEVFTASNGVISVMLKAPGCTLMVAAAGYAPMKFKDPKADLTLKLKPGIGVRLKLGNGVRVPGEPKRVTAALLTDQEMKDPETEARRALGIQTSPDPATFDENGETTVWVADPGRYTILITAGIKKEKVISAVTVPLKDAEISISKDEPKPFVVALSGDALADAFKRLE